jgi:integrase
LLFTSTGNTPPSGFSKAKTELDGLMNAQIAVLTPFRIHDLRRTIVSTLTEMFNYDEELGDRILNHKKKGITKIYNLATRRKERREALLEWSKYILSLDNRVK